MRAAVVALLALVFAPAALAWTPISQGPLQNIDRPATLLTSTGTELVTWSDNGSGLWLWSSKAGTREIETVPFVAQPQIVQQPSGAIQIYAGSGGGVERFQSTDDGATWSGPFAIASPTTTGPVVSATVRPDGTPMFTQDSTFGINVFQGLNGEQVHTVFTQCCGYAESLAVDPGGYAQIAFWSNATSFPNLFVYEGLDGNGAQAGPGRSFGAPQTAPRDDSVPLVASPDGNTYMGWASGYPTATAFAVNTFFRGNLNWSTGIWRSRSIARAASGPCGRRGARCTRGARGARPTTSARRARSGWRSSPSTSWLRSRSRTAPWTRSSTTATSSCTRRFCPPSR
jgi:hypothetical protein